jgi:type II secretory pathway pseudopilin PulG
MPPRSSRASFTLIELLVVVAVLVVLSAVVLFAINPAELLRQNRDTARLSGLGSLHAALSLLQLEGPENVSFGAPNTVYVSIPDSSPTCANLGLQTLTSGWNYACAPSSTHTRVDGTGWVPVNLTGIPGGSTISSLPVDPLNATRTGTYYTYAGGSSWEVDARLESVKYGYGSVTSTPSMSDGGNNDYLYEVGSDLSLLLDNENYLLDGDMEASGVTYWGSYNSPITREKVADASSGAQSIHLVTNGASYSGTYQSFTSTIPESGKVFIQMNYKVAAGKTLGWECNCRSGSCCWYFIFNNGTSTTWTRRTLIRDISAGTALTAAYFSQPNAVASEFWVDDAIVRPMY